MSQETERYQLENNGNTYLVRTPVSGGGADVEANPEGSATEDLEKLKVGETIYGIPEGTEVAANPVLAGTEPALTGLQIGDTKYAVPTPHTINTYTAGTLSEADQAKMANDIANGYPIQIAGSKYIYWASSSYEAIFVSFTNAPIVSDTSIRIANYNLTNHNLGILQNQTIIPINNEIYNFSNTNGTLITKVALGGQSRVFGAMSTYALTTAPTADNTDGGIRLVVLTAEPATYYNGYYYIIAPTP